MGRRILFMDDTFLPMLMGGHEQHYHITDDAMPKDCRVVNVQVQFIAMDRQRICFLLESEAWPPSDEGSPYPEIRPIFRTLGP